MIYVIAFMQNFFCKIQQFRSFPYLLPSFRSKFGKNFGSGRQKTKIAYVMKNHVTLAAILD